MDSRVDNAYKVDSRLHTWSLQPCTESPEIPVNNCTSTFAEVPLQA